MTSTGVIHDIGYRNYEGPRFGRRAIVRALTWHSFRAAFGLGRGARAKIVPVLALGVMCLPAAVSAAITARGGQRLVGYDAYLPALRIVIATIFVSAQAPELVSRDLRARVLPLYFARPVTTADYAAAKFAAFAAACLVLFEAPLLVLYAGTAASLHGPRQVWHETGQLLPGMGIAAIWAVLLAALSLLIASSTGRRAFATGAVAVALTISYAVAGIVIASQGGRPYPTSTSGWTGGLFSPFTLLDGVRLWLTGNADTPSQPVPPGAFGPLYALVTLALIAGSLLALSARYRRAAL